MNMKGNICGVALGVFLAVMSAGVAGAQEYVGTPVEISKEKVKIDGKLCYSHIVLERQTLYSISKAYGVSIDDIYRFNPSIKDTGLKKNSIIIIPSQSALKADQTVQKEEAKINHRTTVRTSLRRRRSGTPVRPFLNPKRKLSERTAGRLRGRPEYT